MSGEAASMNISYPTKLHQMPFFFKKLITENKLCCNAFFHLGGRGTQQNEKRKLGFTVFSPYDVCEPRSHDRFSAGDEDCFKENINLNPFKTILGEYILDWQQFIIFDSMHFIYEAG